MLLNNKSNYTLTIVFNSQKEIVEKGKSLDLDLKGNHVAMEIYVNYKSNIRFRLFPLFKASHFLEDRLKLNIVFNLMLTPENECKCLDIVNCNSNCDTPVKLVSVAPNDYTSVEDVKYFSQEHKKIKRRFFIYEISFIFLLPLWLFGIIMGIAFNNGKLLIGAIACLMLSLVESYKLIKSVNQLTESKMTSQLTESAKLLNSAKSKDDISCYIIKRFFTK